MNRLQTPRNIPRRVEGGQGEKVGRLDRLQSGESAKSFLAQGFNLTVYIGEDGQLSLPGHLELGLATFTDRGGWRPVPLGVRRHAGWSVSAVRIAYIRASSCDPRCPASWCARGASSQRGTTMARCFALANTFSPSATIVSKPTRSRQREIRLREFNITTFAGPSRRFKIRGTRATAAIVDVSIVFISLKKLVSGYEA
jgi:hypothetical protein